MSTKMCWALKRRSDPRGVFLGIRGGGVSPNPDPISDPKIDIFHTRFQTWSLKSMPIFRPGVGRNYVIIT